MRLLLVYLALMTLCLAGQRNNLTGFYAQQMNQSRINFNVYSGYEQINWHYPAGTTGMFYQIFGVPNVDLTVENDHPIFLWLQGGPGASSQFGAFTQVGPILIKNGSYHHNTWAWNLFGHMLFVDSPLNVGFSYSNASRQGKQQVNSTIQATTHLINFLDNFNKTWPSLSQSKIYIVGQSFGGHYAPVLANRLLSNSTWSHRVGGLIIGDGWTDPLNQINYFDTYLWSVGVIDRSFRQTCSWFQTQSMLNMDTGNFQKATDYFDFLTNNDTTAQVHFGNISMFNFRNYDGLDTSFATILNKNKQPLGAKVDYLMSNENVYTAFGKDITQTVVQHVVKTLRRARVLIYNGQNDVVVNTPGVLHYLSSIDWQHISQWIKSKKQIFHISDEPVGWVKTYQNLWFALINGAGHMVPSDKPIPTYHMIKKFMQHDNHWNV